MPLHQSEVRNREAIYAIRKICRESWIPRSLSDEARAAVAKTQLYLYANLLDEITIHQETAREFNRTSRDMIQTISHLYTTEQAMIKGDWALALHEMKNIFYYVAFWHEIPYTNLVRIFNQYLNAGMRIKVSEHINAITELKGYEYMLFGFCEDFHDTLFCTNVIRSVNGRLRMEKERDKQLAIYDWAIMAIKESYRTSLFELGVLNLSPDASDMIYVFPSRYIKDGKEVDIQETKYRGEPIPVKDTCLVSVAPDKDRTLSAFMDVKAQGFNQNLGDYQITYYPEANMCVTYSGFHHTAMASLFQDGSITPDTVISLAEIFPYVKTNGRYWIDIATNKEIEETFNSRTATIYELLRQKHRLEISE